MRYASIDIGTNTLRLLVADLSDSGELVPLRHERRITRLGGGYTEARGIAPEAAERTLRALSDFSRIIDDSRGEGDRDCRVRAVATSVVRRAANRDRFLDEALRRAGLRVSVISGGEEARLSLLGVLSVVGRAGERDRLIIDIGGGSTEFVAARGAGVMAGAWSMEMGVVHLSEIFLRSDPPAGAELDAMKGEIERVLKDLKERMREDGISPDNYCKNNNAELVGTAGTVTTLAALDMDLQVYDRKRVNNHILKRAGVAAEFERLSGLTLAGRSEILPLERGREDLIVPGAAIVLGAMDSFGFTEMTVSDAGLLEGVILDRHTAGREKQGGGDLT